jgi:DNA/RNA endonuclease YhcR with UshA esterase domain
VDGIPISLAHGKSATRFLGLKKIREEESMKWRSRVLGALALALCVSALPLHAQTSDVKTKPVTHLRYDITKEVTLSGTVSSVVKSPTREMNLVPGSHLFVGTKAGTIDASLGKFAMRGDGALSIKAGEAVQVTGVMKTAKEKQVFIVRLVHANGHEYMVRNEHGFVLAPVSRKGVTGSEAKGGQL